MINSSVEREFRVTDGPTNLCFYNRQLKPIFPIGLCSLRYFQVSGWSDAKFIHSNCLANVKLLKSLNLPNFGDVKGYALEPLNSIILTEAASVTTPVHEWGHLCGLEHRNAMTNGINLNIGPTHDGIMSETDNMYYPRKTVNSWEKNFMNAYPGPLLP